VQGVEDDGAAKAAEETVGEGAEGWLLEEFDGPLSFISTSLSEWWG
jgi:hypothetical protein